MLIRFLNGVPMAVGVLAADAHLFRVVATVCLATSCPLLVHNSAGQS
jgi:hypothetical protein